MMSAAPQISIVTPSFRSGRWLPLAIASVTDQTGVAVEHIVQDSCSDDGTLDWLPGDPRVKAFVEKDQGMYDAVNRGLRRAQGEILAYLNCDEQYLPGALKAVADFFAARPEVEVVFADALIVDEEGRYRSHRGALLPTKCHTLVSGGLAILTCATFFRRSILDKQQLFFDPRHRIVGDTHWVLSLLGNRVRMACLPRFTTAFTDTGDNLSFTAAARREQAELAAAAPGWARALRPVIILHHRLRRLLAGQYFAPPFTYSIYTASSRERRVSFQVDRPTAVYRRAGSR